ncbi:nuclear transport factor 2 family protein [Chryseobacterium bernardetii]|uniref:Nuclear transport factor 2 family protein n=1 Tax=Chryseobacterium bernardetii TaxID=1241978 RepID=A0A3G6THH8_9FLAO|nr:nuclear transport factor 2 family protein [Chryseobacterium bernardetii]AZB25704.1 nuclear transport factor 2 family protein [Chryseobacterium bernardetii]AZB36085.1 nuclear transport factor 2 family protein [Chryseobacterium bernardetii]
MKRLLLLFVLSFNLSFAQAKDETEIRKVMNDFMESIKTRNETQYLSLFQEPVLWTGIYKDRTQAKRLEKNPKAEYYFADDYKAFIKGFKDDKSEEKFDNIKIVEDGAVASANFDYSFWYDGKMENWGKEIWTLMKINGIWKITSVTFSMDLAKYFPQPSLNERTKK